MPDLASLSELGWGHHTIRLRPDTGFPGYSHSGSVPGMASLRDQFQHFYAPGEDTIAAVIQTGLVTPDANACSASTGSRPGRGMSCSALWRRSGTGCGFPIRLALSSTGTGSR